MFRVCLLSLTLQVVRDRFRTNTRAQPRNSHRCVRACLPCGHTLAAPPTCYLNESIKPPSNYLSYAEQARTAYSPRRGQTIAVPGLSRVALFVFHLILSSCRIFHRVALFLSPLTHFSRTILLRPRARADNGVFPCLQETRPRFAYLRVTARLFENRKTRKNQEKSNGLVSTNYEIHNEFIEGVCRERLAAFLKERHSTSTIQSLRRYIFVYLIKRREKRNRN